MKLIGKHVMNISLSRLKSSNGSLRIYKRVVLKMVCELGYKNSNSLETHREKQSVSIGFQNTVFTLAYDISYGIWPGQMSIIR